MQTEDQVKKRVSIFNTRNQGALVPIEPHWDLNDVLEKSCERLKIPGDWRGYGLALRKNGARIFSADEIRDDEDLLIFDLETYASGELPTLAFAPVPTASPYPFQRPTTASPVKLPTQNSTKAQKSSTTTPVPVPAVVVQPEKVTKADLAIEKEIRDTLISHLGGGMCCVALPHYLVSGEALTFSALIEKMKDDGYLSDSPAAWQAGFKAVKQEILRFGKASFFYLTSAPTKNDKLALSTHGLKWFRASENKKAYKKYLMKIHKRFLVKEQRRHEAALGRQTDSLKKKRVDEIPETAEVVEEPPLKKAKSAETKNKSKAKKVNGQSPVKKESGRKPGSKKESPKPKQASQSPRVLRSKREESSDDMEEEELTKPTTAEELFAAAKRKSVPADQYDRTVWLHGISHKRGDQSVMKIVMSKLEEEFSIPPSAIVAICKDPGTELWFVQFATSDIAQRLIGYQIEVGQGKWTDNVMIAGLDYTTPHHSSEESASEGRAGSVSL